MGGAHTFNKMPGLLDPLLEPFRIRAMGPSTSLVQQVEEIRAIISSNIRTASEGIDKLRN
jgi:hypothetical protein